MTRKNHEYFADAAERAHVSLRALRRCKAWTPSSATSTCCPQTSSPERARPRPIVDGCCLSPGPSPRTVRRRRRT